MAGHILQRFRPVGSLLKIKVTTNNDFHVPSLVNFLRVSLGIPAGTGCRRALCILRKSTIQVKKDENITLIGISREEYRNSIDLNTSKLLFEAINRFEQDTHSPVAVLYGIGGSFSAGHDVIELEQKLEQRNFNNLFNLEGSIAPTRRHLKKPIVCAINGFCVASGLELALLCDLRVMEDTAVIGFFNRALGVPISDGGTVRLSKLIGHSRALDMIATGRRMSAKEAFEIGLANRIVATGTALGQAVNLAFSISKFSQNALLHDRKSIYTNVYETENSDATVQEKVMLPDEVISELRKGIRKFVKSETKGAKVDSFNIKEKPVPDWEKDEIRREEAYRVSKFNILERI